MSTPIIESGPSPAGRLLTHATRLTVRTALRVGCHAPHLPWPYGAVEFVAHGLPKPRGTKRVTIQLPNTAAELVHASGVYRRDRVVLYFHGGAFLTCGLNTHAGLITRLSQYSNAPVLAVDYRMIPRHSVADAIEDCIDAYDWLRHYYAPDQIVLAGDSAGGYLALATATHLLERPAALVMMSPLLQLNPEPKKLHPNIGRDAMFGPEAFDALFSLVARAGFVYEPLDDLVADLPPTLIHVSGDEALLHDVELAAEGLAVLGVPVEVHVWPGQIHVFQMAAPLVPEASCSLKQIGEFIQTHTKEGERCCGIELTDRTGTVG